MLEKFTGQDEFGGRVREGLQEREVSEDRLVLENRLEVNGWRQVRMGAFHEQGTAWLQCEAFQRAVKGEGSTGEVGSSLEGQQWWVMVNKNKNAVSC